MPATAPPPRIAFRNDTPRDFQRALRRRVASHLTSAGATRHADARLWMKAATLAAVAFGSYAALLLGDLPGGAMLAFATLAAIAALLLGINLGHDAAHDALTPNRVVNRLLHHASFTLIGADAYLWRLRHVRSHHVFPNVNGCDLDIDESPFLRLSPNHRRRQWHRFQHLYAPLVYCLAGVHTAFWQDFAYLRKRELADMRDLRPPAWALAAFLVSKLAYVGLTFLVPLAVLDAPWWAVVGGALFASAVQSMLFVALLIGTHFAEEAEFPAADAAGSLPGDWASHALRTAIDWSPGSRLAVALTGGANCHAAHHLFPGVSHVHYRGITPIIAATAAEFGLPYHRMTLPALLRSHFSFLRRLGRA